MKVPLNSGQTELCPLMLHLAVRFQIIVNKFLLNSELESIKWYRILNFLQPAQITYFYCNTFSAWLKDIQLGKKKSRHFIQNEAHFHLDS
jgi:hypothetical protein